MLHFNIYTKFQQKPLPPQQNLAWGLDRELYILTIKDIVEKTKVVAKLTTLKINL